LAVRPISLAASDALISLFLEKKKLKTLDTNQILDCAYTDIQKFNVQSNWGYSLDTLISAIHDCSPNWIKFLMSKNTLSVKGIRAILDALPYEKREVSYFSKELAEAKYLEYMDNYVNDHTARVALTDALRGRSVLLLCPGKTLNTHRAGIDKYVAEHNPIVTTVNFITDKFTADYAFISNTNRYSQMLGLCSDFTDVPPVLLTSNIVSADTLLPLYVYNYKTLYEAIQGDNSAVLLISLLTSIGVKHIAIAGMDGYTNEPNDCFFDDSMKISYSSKANELIARQVSNAIGRSTASIEWLTPSWIVDLLDAEQCRKVK
jgi:4-hydroxy 2-oxovalerate aldolase